MDLLTALVRDNLPTACRRPDSLFDVPAIVLSDISCAKATLSLVLGLGIVVMAGIIKFPQIIAIISAQSGDGLSMLTLVIETFAYSYNFAAHYRLRYPLSTYGDFAVLILQNSIIIMLVHRFANKPSAGAATVAGLFCGLVLMCLPAFPISVLKLMTLANVPVTIAARVPQIMKSFQNKSTGSLSVITCCGLFLGSSARVFTTLQDVDNMNILLGYIVSASLNAVIAAQVLYYGDWKRQGSAPEKKQY
jgi:mannose-P-dolichol utilization defect 1